jgi:protein phosphatase inhibitor 2
MLNSNYWTMHILSHDCSIPVIRLPALPTLDVQLPARAKPLQNTMTDEQPKPRSILRNAPPAGSYETAARWASQPFDRQAVLENTKLNAQLHDVGSTIRSDANHDINGIGDDLTSNGNDGASGNGNVNTSNGNDHLKWDEANLYLTEQEKAATMKITEPKTPYQGAVGDSEYYRSDDDTSSRGDAESLENFALGESELPAVGSCHSGQGSRITRREDYADDSDQEQESDDNYEETPEERHRRFERLRKEHYRMKGDVLHHPMPSAEDDEDDNEDDEVSGN